MFMNEFSVLLNDFFVKYLAKSKGVSDNTSKNYRDTFVQLLLFLEEKKKIAPCKVNLDTLGYEMVNEFLDWLESERNVSISTRNNRLAGIKSFFQYISRCRPERIAQCSEILSISAKKCVSKPMNYLTIDAYKALLQVFDDKSKTSLRELCIVSLLYESGARVTEFINIKAYEIRTTIPATLVLHGKGNKTRIVPIDKSIIALINRYIAMYDIKSDEYLFFNSRRQRLTRKGIDYIVEKNFSIAKEKRPDLFPNTFSPHCLRHTRAMHLLQNGVNLIYIRDLLGHTSVTTTEIYSKANPDIKRKHIEEASAQLIDVSDYDDTKKDDLLDWLINNI